MTKLLQFLCEFPFFSSEKKLLLYLEDFLSREYFSRPILVYSVKDSEFLKPIGRCRTIYGKSDRILLYSSRIIDEYIMRLDEIKSFTNYRVKVDKSNYYYLNFGVLHKQFVFAIFSSPVEIDHQVLECLSRFVSSHLKVIMKVDELYKTRELAHIDDVTGLYNQRRLYKDLSTLIKRYSHENELFSVLFIDIDFFKKINDKYGHLVGTKLLELLAKDIKNQLRDSDICYRYGGDEFVVILPMSDGKNSKIVGERILRTIKEKKIFIEFQNEKLELSLSVSIGIAEFPHDAKNSEEILAIADRMMYEAKDAGRGIVFNTQDLFKSSLKKVIDTKRTE